jgi:transcription-repair coupling factor (superfamily II helicase)
VIAFAKELLELYAKKEVSLTDKLTEDKDLEKELDNTFEFNLTEDQEKAITEIYSDLESGRLMDRLILGDVGFGKTEVAVRAAFRVALHKKQVVLLAPTTILVKQHEEVFKGRLEALGLTVVSMSRLNSGKEDKEILEKIELGEADIIIGTHRLLSSDVKFKNLGMLIIDEEQKFGVKQKEKIRSLYEKIHVLSLSATPIPRTLNIAMSGFKKMSIIETAPINRLPINTYILPYKKNIVIEAINKEIEREGQVFYIHNRIASIQKQVLDLKKSLGKLRIDYLHGRMSEMQILKVMNKFKAKEIDVLVSTTIIENGLDLSNVNTLVVEDATRLGLGEAYQLRGRIGRGGLESFAYFFYPKHLIDKSKLRLEALKEANYLGAGYQIALRDLEIRGAGNILGKAQSGNINKVGYNLYCQMLNQAMSGKNIDF